MEEKQRLPKNIRQVGDRDERYRVYLEDYVNTYLERFTRGVGETTFGVLIGTSCVVEGNACIFCFGAMEVKHLKQEDELLFSESGLERAKQKIREYFPGGTMCGLFICGDEDALPDPDTVEKMQEKYFPESGSLTYLCNGEDAAFLYRNEGGFCQLRGYYIYYERNEGMQSFLVEHNRGERVERAGKDSVVEDFRERLSLQKQNSVEQGVRMTNLLCAALAMVVVLLGAFMLRNQGKLRSLEQAVAVLSAPEGTQGDHAEHSAEDGFERISVVYVTEGEKTSAKAPGEEAKQETSSADGASEEAGQPMEAGAKVPACHIVSRGETLTYISQLYFGDSAHVKAICELNGLTNPNSITSGQLLLLPEH